jgi:hypothetical protein
MRHELRGQIFEALRACGAEICRIECGYASSFFNSSNPNPNP